MRGSSLFTVQSCRLLVFGVALASIALFPPTASAAVPELRYESPPELAPQVDDLRRSFQPSELEPIMELVGLDEPGPPIRVLVVPEGSEPASLLPSWGVAYALGHVGTVVLVPSRIPTYPNDDLPAVLRHEIAHVLIARAAGHRPVPRWLNEGLSTIAGRRWDLRDSGRLMLAALPREGLSMAEVERGFHGGGWSAQRAYALSTAFVRWLRDQAGAEVGARILKEIAAGRPFPDAVERATGRSLRELETMYWKRLNLWHRWVPFLTSSAFLWILVTGLALMAFYRRRERNEERLEEWEEEEAEMELRRLPADEWVN